jgi:tripartite-type tricarboxylate transporter receptor subunit TctC
MFRIKVLAAAAALSGLLAVHAANAQQFPTRDLAGSIMWGAGGAMDVVSRAITPMVEPILGKSIILTNRTGGSGAIATIYVNSRPSDGYNLLYGAENPELYKVLGLATIDYDDFYAVNIMARGIGVVAVRADASWKTLSDLINDAKKRPGQIKMGTTGVGGLPHTVGSMLQTITKYDVVSVSFDGEGPSVTALLGGHVDFIPIGIGAVSEHVKAGRLRLLTVINGEPIATIPGVPPVTAEYPEFAKYLPWGPFYGVFIKKDTPDAVKKTLTAAFAKATQDPKFIEIMASRGNLMMNISGAEADQFLKKWRSVTSWVLQEAGAAKESPEKFGIAKP